MTEKYMKSDEWEGRYLSLHVGRGQKTVRDGEVLVGPRWGQFVGMGFLKKISEDEAMEAAAAPPPPPDREPVLSKPQQPESMTRAPKAPTPGKGTSTSTKKSPAKKSPAKKAKKKKK